MVLRTFTDSDEHLTQWLVTLLHQKAFIPSFLSCSAFLKITLTKKNSYKDQFVIVSSDSHGSVALSARYYLLEKLQAGTPFSCKTASENEKSDWGGYSAREEGRITLSKLAGSKKARIRRCLKSSTIGEQYFCVL